MHPAVKLEPGMERKECGEEPHSMPQSENRTNIFPIGFRELRKSDEVSELHIVAKEYH